MTSVQERLFDVRDTRAVVTGAASGLGYAIAEVLADCGARVTLADIDAERLESVTASLAERGASARSHVVDVSDESQVEALIADVVAAEGGLDVVFANAGIAATPGFAVEGGQRLDAVARSDWDRVLGVNLNGVLFTMKYAAAVMQRQGSALDLEATGSLGARLLQSWTQAWVQEVYARLGVHPFVYSSPAFWQQYLADSPAVAAVGTPLWIAHWTSASQPWVPAQDWNGAGWTLAVDELPLRPRNRTLHGRQPDERGKPHGDRDRALRARRADALDSAEHRRSS